MMNNIRRMILLFAVLGLTASCTTKIPVLAVQLADDDGRNRVAITTAEIKDWVNYANKTWEDRGYEFTFDEKKDLIMVQSTVLNTQPDDSNDAQWEFYRIAGNYVASLLPDRAIPIFFRAKGGSGWSWGPGNTNFVSMPAYANTCIVKPTPGKPCPGGCCPNNTLLSHELGHYFGLAHTFTDADCAKATLANTDGDVQGQLLGTTADDVHDTNPDPGAACAPTKSLDCDGGSVVVNGVTFHPPWNNLMSYHDCLPERISKDQTKVIEYSLQQPWRANLGKED
jgi:Pregnancy-associated plasma protein-A